MNGRTLITSAAIVLVVAVVGYRLVPAKQRSFARFMLASAAGGVTKTGQVGDGREERLLARVRADAPKGDPKAVLDTIDKFAWGGEWLMNVGDRKGLIVDEALHNANAAATAAKAAGSSNWSDHYLEVGTYCGYSAVRIASQLPPDAKLFSLEYSLKNAEIARAVVEHAGLSNRVEILHATIDSNAIQLLRGKSVNTFQFIFLDHWKDLYIPDLQKLIDQGFLHKGTYVVADNLVTPGNPQYIKWQQNHTDFSFQLIEAKLEYQDDLKDAVGISIYKGPGGPAAA